MSKHDSNEKCVSVISKKRRHDVDALHGLTQKFPEVIKTFSHGDLHMITEYYKPFLTYVIEHDITSILENLVTKHILTTDEAKSFKAKEESEGQAAVEVFISDIMKMDSIVLVSLWEALAEEILRFPSPNLSKILTEVTEQGPELLTDIEASLKSPPIDAHIKDLHDLHRGGVLQPPIPLEDQGSPGYPHASAMGSESGYTELMVDDRYIRTYSERYHELVKIGNKDAEPVEKRTTEKCDQVWMKQLFRRSPGSETTPHIVVVSGVAGIGKTTIVQKIMLDWARGTQYQRFAFVFLFKFREFNLLDIETERQISLTGLIGRHYKHLGDPKLKEILQKPESLLFIFDGVDEYKHKLDFKQEQLCTNPDDPFPVHILVTSLVSRALLKGCSVLITSKPTALETLDMKRVDYFAEILGFFPEQRLMYFKKFFGDTDLGTEAFRYAEDNPIVYTMCFNPSYCWMICSALKSHFMTPKELRGTAPRTVTEVFVMFLHNILSNHKQEAEDKQGILVKLGKMAYYGVENRTLVFYDKFEMSTFGLQLVLSSPILKEILQRESSLDHTTYTFNHLTLQEFMAACFFYLDPSGDIEELFVKMDTCKDGRFVIFTQFLVGLARPSVLKILGGILGDLEMKTEKRVLEWVKKKAEKILWSEAASNVQLIVCQWLYETQNDYLIREVIGKDLKLDFSHRGLSHLECDVLNSVIGCCGELGELDLSYTLLTPEFFRRLAPCLICCRSINLTDYAVSSECCLALSSILSDENSRLTELKLFEDELEYSGVAQLCEGLRSENCKLEKLRLCYCFFTPGCCSVLSSVLSSPHSRLTELWLDYNDLEVSEVDQLCEGLKSKNCKIKKLSLSQCNLTSGCLPALSSVLSSPHSQMTELDLSANCLSDSGVTELCEGLKSENCKLETLSLSGCSLTSGCCPTLCSVLSCPHASLTKLDLMSNKLEDLGVNQLCEGLRSENCKLEKLSLVSCHLTSGCCSSLSSALSAPHSRLTELQLDYNDLQDSGVDQLCEGLRSENCKLHKLSLRKCGLTSGCCSALTSALSAEHSNLTKLVLYDNNLEDSGVDQLCVGLRSENCKLQKLGVHGVGISEEEKWNLKLLEEELNRSGRRLEINV
ncbi:NACHT, LRR and PYD domains-containing protein 3-like [Polypterus senegalus]